MFSLYTTIIATALFLSAVGATMYYSGSATDEAILGATSATLITQAEQLNAAMHFRAFEKKYISLNSLDELQYEGYLNEIPVPPVDAYVSGNSTHADWTMVAPAAIPMVLLHNKITKEVCSRVNQRLNYDADISPTIDDSRRIQCVGTSEPYTLVINPDTSAVAAAEFITEWNTAVTNTPSQPPTVNIPAALETGEVALSRTNIIGTLNKPITYDFKPLFNDSRESQPNLAEVQWAVEGTLPAGLSLDSATGVLSGTPTEKITKDYTITATYKKVIGKQQYTIYIQDYILKSKQLALSWDSTCAITLTDDLVCWGVTSVGSYRELTYAQAVPELEPLAGNVRSITSGGGNGTTNTCVVMHDSTLKCWGNLFMSFMQSGYLGYSHKKNYRVPTTVETLTDVKSIAMGVQHLCALLNTGKVFCSGMSLNGEVGIKKDYQSVPFEVTGFPDPVVKLAVGTGVSCALTTKGAVLCWGKAANLGSAAKLDSPTPVQVTGLESGVKDIVAGGGIYGKTPGHACALTEQNGMKCWGSGYGALGQSGVMFAPTPIDVPRYTSGVKSIATGWAHSCAVREAGNAGCWGSSYVNGATSGPVLGFNNLWRTLMNTNEGPGYDKSLPPNNNYSNYPSVANPDHHIFVRLPGQPIASIQASALHTCAILENADTYCWGNTDYGKIGIGFTVSIVPEPGAVSTIWWGR